MILYSLWDYNSTWSKNSSWHYFDYIMQCLNICMLSFVLYYPDQLKTDGHFQVYIYPQTVNTNIIILIISYATHTV